MKDRLGGFGDIVFGLLLAGIVASYLGPLEHLISSGKASAIPGVGLLWMAMAPIFQFMVVCIFWALQARIVTRLFVDHVAFIVGYLGVLYFLFGWVMADGAIQDVLNTVGLPKATISIIAGPALMISTAFAILLVLGIGGLTYHWPDLSALGRYESLRDCSLVALSAFLAGLVATVPALIQAPFDLLTLIAVVIGLRFVMAMFLDPRAVEWWGTIEERRHYTKVLLAGSVLMLLLGILFLATFAAQSALRPSIIIWIGGGIFIFLAVASLRKQLKTLRTL